MTRVLFVCLGNICRSPSAEGMFRRMAAEAGLAVEVDSAGTGGWHVGDPPDQRAAAAALTRGVDISGLRARQVAAEDFGRFDLVIGMDRRNVADLRRMAPEGAIELFLDYAPEQPVREVPDPYYDGGFGAALDLIEAASAGLIRAFEAGLVRS